MKSSTSTSNIRFHYLHEPADEFEVDVLQGLKQRPASVPPKYFYDKTGSELFDRITSLPEYYPTRTEIDILSRNAQRIAQHIGTGSLLVEPGGGSLAKVHILLQGLQPCAYVPMDISRDHLMYAAEELASAFPWLEIHAACTDFTRQMQLPPQTPAATAVAFFPGSSIGNFDPEHAVEFLSTIAELVGDGGYLLIGVDLKKDHQLLQAAYDDAQGITALFNLNLLTRINRELQGDFNVAQWQHKALYNEALGRIEMHLLSLQDQRVNIAAQEFHFKQGETIHTENSYKYTTDEFIQLAARAGFETVDLWLDDDELFSVHLYKLKL